jgi:hypothetical protein
MRPQRLFRRSPFAYPAGHAPGFDPTHVAAFGSPLAAVTLSGGLINLLTGQAGSNVSSPVPVQRSIGPCLTYDTTNYAYTEFSSLFTSNTVATYAGIILLTDTSSFSCIGSDGNNQFAIYNGNLCFYIDTGGLLSSNINLSANVPYFVAGSFLTGYGANFVAVNLQTGQTQTYFASGPSYVLGATFGAITIGNNRPSYTGQPLNGYLATVMYGTTFLSLSQLLAWAAEPWSFWYPGTLGEKLFRSLAAAVSATTPVTVFSGFAAEIIASVRADRAASLEALASRRADAALALEQLAGQRADGAAPTELLAGRRADGAAPLEILAAMRGDQAQPLEVLASRRIDAPIALEQLAGLRADGVAVLEQLAGVGAERAAVLELLGGIGVTADSRIAIEIIAATRADAPIAAESVAALRRDVAAALEQLAGIRADSRVAGESLAGLRADAPIAAEGLAAMRGDMPIALEELAGARADAWLAGEILVGLRADRAAALEIVGAVALTADGRINVEILAGTAADAAALVEIKGGLMMAASGLVNIEILGGINFRADGAVSIEILSSLASDNPVLLDVVSEIARIVRRVTGRAAIGIVHGRAAAGTIEGRD